MSLPIFIKIFFFWNICSETFLAQSQSFVYLGTFWFKITYDRPTKSPTLFKSQIERSSFFFVISKLLSSRKQRVGSTSFVEVAFKILSRFSYKIEQNWKKQCNDKNVNRLIFKNQFHLTLDLFKWCVQRKWVNSLHYISCNFQL